MPHILHPVHRPDSYRVGQQSQRLSVVQPGDLFPRGGLDYIEDVETASVRSGVGAFHFPLYPVPFDEDIQVSNCLFSECKTSDQLGFIRGLTITTTINEKISL